MPSDMQQFQAYENGDERLQALWIPSQERGSRSLARSLGTIREYRIERAGYSSITTPTTISIRLPYTVSGLPPFDSWFLSPPVLRRVSFPCLVTKTLRSDGAAQERMCSALRHRERGEGLAGRDDAAINATTCKSASVLA